MRRALAALFACAAAGCGGGADRDGAEERWTGPVVTVTSPSFKADEPMPPKHLAETGNASPLVKWSSVPEGTEEFALVADDPDERDTVYWVVYSIPKAATGLPENVPLSEAALRWPAGAVQGENSWSEPGYRGPEQGKRCRFVVYALRAPLHLKPGASVADLRDAMKGRVLGRGELVGCASR